MLDNIVITSIGFAVIAFVAWFFFGKKENALDVEDEITIAVRGGYKPSVIRVKKDKEVRLKFHRTDSSSCLEEVVLSDFKIRKFLPLNEIVSITLTPKKTGEFLFSCGMNMFHGKIIVKG